MIHDLLRHIGEDIHEAVARIERTHGVGSQTVVMRWSETVELTYDPSALQTGFVLQLRALTDSGWLEASFSPSGELSRGLLGDTLVIDGERLIRLWQTERERAGDGDDAMA